MELWWVKVDWCGKGQRTIPMMLPPKLCKKAAMRFAQSRIMAAATTLDIDPDSVQVVKVKKPWVWRPWKYGALSGF